MTLAIVSNGDVEADLGVKVAVAPSAGTNASYGRRLLAGLSIASLVSIFGLAIIGLGLATIGSGGGVGWGYLAFGAFPFAFVLVLGTPLGMLTHWLTRSSPRVVRSVAFIGAGAAGGGAASAILLSGRIAFWTVIIGAVAGGCAEWWADRVAASPRRLAQVAIAAGVLGFGSIAFILLQSP